MRLPVPVRGTVESLDGDKAHIRLEAGGLRELATSPYVEIAVGMSVKIQDMPDGSSPVVAWGVG